MQNALMYRGYFSEMVERGMISGHSKLKDKILSEHIRMESLSRKKGSVR